LNAYLHALIAGMPAQNPCVLIATPTRGSPKMQYVHSIIGTIKDLATRRIKSDFVSLAGSGPAIQRSVLATQFLESREFTHMFFVDDDMSFPDDTCARLLAADKAVIGTIATKRVIHLDRIEKALSKGASLKQAFLAGHEWVIGPHTQSSSLVKIEIVDSSSSFGFGAVLVRRDAFQLILDKRTASRYSLSEAHIPAGAHYHGFFQPRPQDPPGVFSEDESFYRRWQLDCGGEVWALTDASIVHIGDFPYGGRYSDLMPSR
jgi:hypothetical protein